GSTRMPCSVTSCPFTSTRPSLIMSSATRREATPAAARTFCSRTPASLRCSASRGFFSNPLVSSLIARRRTCLALRSSIDRRRIRGRCGVGVGHVNRAFLVGFIGYGLRSGQLAQLGLELVDLGQVGGEGRQVVQTPQTHPLQEVAGGPEQDGPG